MPKVGRSGQARILSPEQLEELFNELKLPHRLICQIAYYSAARIGEVCSLRVENLVAGEIVYRASDTKTGASRSLRIVPPLQRAIDEAKLPRAGYLFPGKFAGHISTQAVDLALRKACDYLGLEGVSSHSFRRSLLTHLYREGHDLRTIQRVSGHKSLGSLALYLDVDSEAAEVALLSMFS